LASSNHQIAEFNTAQIIQRRILYDRTRNAWFRAHGMPNGKAALEQARANAADGLIDNTTALLHDPVFGPWAVDHGPRTYARYLITHPGYVVTTPFPDGEAYRSSLSGVTVYGHARRVVPTFVDSVFWPQSEAGRAWFQVFLAVGLGAVIVRAA